MIRHQFFQHKKVYISIHFLVSIFGVVQFSKASAKLKLFVSFNFHFGCFLLLHLIIFLWASRSRWERIECEYIFQSMFSSNFHFLFINLLCYRNFDKSACFWMGPWFGDEMKKKHHFMSMSGHFKEILYNGYIYWMNECSQFLSDNLYFPIFVPTVSLMIFKKTWPCNSKSKLAEIMGRSFNIKIFEVKKLLGEQIDLLDFLSQERILTKKNVIRRK